MVIGSFAMLDAFNLAHAVDDDFLAVLEQLPVALRRDLDVSEHEVVPPRESTHGWLPVETRVRARAIVVLQPARQDPAAIAEE